MEHTEGSWEAEELLVDGRIITKAGTFEIRTPDYDVATLVPGGGPFRKKADAVLAAAAPEMFQFIVRVAAIADAACGGGFTDWHDYMDAKALHIDASRIIAKAEGK